MSAPIRNRIEPGIFERLDADGSRLGLEISWKDANGAKRRRSVEGGVREARDELAKARTKRVRRESEPADPRITLASVIERFEAAHAGRRANTINAYRASFARIEPVLGSKRITTIGRADVKAFVAVEVSDGLKANTIRLHYSALRALFNFAREDLEIPVTFPRLKPSELPDPAEDQREHRILTDEELGAVLSACAPRTGLLVRLLAETGLRLSEGLAVTPDAVEDGTVRVTRQMGRDGATAPLKTRRSRREIEITRGLSAALRLVDGFPITHRRVEKDFQAAVKLAEIGAPRPVIHDLRHTHASKLIAAGWDPVEVAKRLGDRVETTLKTYAHEFDARRRGEERRAALEGMYGDGPRMAPDGSSRVVTRGAEVHEIRSHRNTA